MSVDNWNESGSTDQITLPTELARLLNDERVTVDPLNDLDSECVEGTGMWLLEDQTFRLWLQRREPLLWICGGPSVGKPHIASSMISALRPKKYFDPGTPTASVFYFFFSKTKGYSSAYLIAHALRIMAHQLSQNDHRYRRYLEALDRSTATDTVPSIWQKMFVGYFSTSGRSLFMVIDGLDEIMDDTALGHKQLLKLMSDLYRKQQVQKYYDPNNMIQQDMTQDRTYPS
jgi:hypothetical protein